MADSGRFVINDIVLTIPPEQIVVEKRAVNHFWQTLRTRSSQKIKSGWSEVSISVIAKFTSEFNGFTNLRRLISQFRVTPFCYVENKLLRSTLMNGNKLYNMALALKQVEILTVDNEPNTLQVVMSFAWFNYFPLMTNMTFKKDLFSAEEVKTPDESNAWKLLTWAEQERARGADAPYLSVKNLTTDLNASFTAYIIATVGNLAKLRKEVIVLKQLKDFLINRETNIKFDRIPLEVKEFLSERLSYDSDEDNVTLNDDWAQLVISEVFGNITSMSEVNSQEEAKNLLFELIKTISHETNISSTGRYETVLDESSWGITLLNPGGAAEISGLLSKGIKVTSGESANLLQNQKLILQKKRSFNFMQEGVIPIQISISFENVLAQIPLIGHTYPTYQHIGSIDAVVTIVAMTKSEQAISKLSSFYEKCENQHRKMRSIPSGQKNLVIENSLINMCGLKEFIVNELNIATVPGQPGTTQIRMQIIENPLKKGTTESLVSRSSYATSSELRNEIEKIFNGFLKLKKNVFHESGSLREFFDTAWITYSHESKLNTNLAVQKTSNRHLINRSFNPDQIQAIIREQALNKKEQSLNKNLGIDNIFSPEAQKGNSLYAIDMGKLDPKQDAAFIHILKEYSYKLSKIFVSLGKLIQDDLIIASVKSAKDVVTGSFGVFLTMDNSMVRNIERLQKDLEPIWERGRRFKFYQDRQDKDKNIPMEQLYGKLWESTITNQAELFNLRAIQSYNITQRLKESFYKDEDIERFKEFADEKRKTLIEEASGELDLMSFSTSLLGDVAGILGFKGSPLNYFIGSSLISTWNDESTKLIDTILSNQGILSLPQFKKIKEMKGRVRIGSSGDCYPDFPMRDMVKAIQDEAKLGKGNPWGYVIAELKSLIEKTVLPKNVDLSMLLNPDFYLYNRTNDTMGRMIGHEVIRSVIDMVKANEGTYRFASEKSFYEKAYADKLLGSYRSDKMKREVLGPGAEDFGKKKDKFFWSAERRGPEILERIRQRLKSDYGKVFAPDNLYESLLPSAAMFSELDSPIEIAPIKVDTDPTNTLSKLREGGVLKPNELHYTGQHRLDYDSIDFLAEQAYQPPPPPDSLKIPYFGWPCDQPPKTKLTSRFGDVRKNLDKNPHKGIDLAPMPGASEDIPIVAAADGEIFFCTKGLGKYSKTYGERALKKINKEYAKKRAASGLNIPADLKSVNELTLKRILRDKTKEDAITIKIKHSGGWTTQYTHLLWDDITRFWSGLLNETWEALNINGSLESVDPAGLLQIKKGQVIGHMGSTGYSTGVHLHFETRLNNKPKNPIHVLNGYFNKSQGPTVGLDPINESLLTRSVEQFELEMKEGQGIGMMRAYPTFKLYFIESDLGERKVFAFDDFFSYNAVSNIEVIRSRKIPCDLCAITLTNISGTLSGRRFKGKGFEFRSREKIDPKVNKENINTIKRDTVEENPLNTIMLQEGVQVQLRLGYDNNPENLDNVFNGVITEIQFNETDDVLTIICQSFAIELVQRIYGDVHEFGGWNLVSKQDGYTGKIIQNLLNMPEVVHFGKWEAGVPDATKGTRKLLHNRWRWIADAADDNVFAPSGTGVVGNFLDKIPIYKMHKTTLWDTIQELTLRHPGMIAYVLPYEGRYGPRSTLFFGVPDQLYVSRDPDENEDFNLSSIGRILDSTLSDEKQREQIEDASSTPDITSTSDHLNHEKKKFSTEVRDVWIKAFQSKYLIGRGVLQPFRKYHLITSGSHIIANNLQSSSRDTFNTVTITYSDGTPGTSDQGVDIRWLNKKTHTEKCDAALPDEDVRELFVTFPNCVGQMTARMYALALLNKSLKDGYKGNLIIIGNPRIKPYDICYIDDNYTDVSGPIEVEQVVHKFSQRTGFITEITPDMVIHVNQSSTRSTFGAMGLIVETVLKQQLGKVGLGHWADGVEDSFNETDTSDKLWQNYWSLIPSFLGVFSSDSGQAAMLGKATPSTIRGTMGYMVMRNFITRTQFAHPLRYNPLNYMGRPMLGGLPHRVLDSSFLNMLGIKKFFRESEEFAGLFLDYAYGKLTVINRWAGSTSEGDFVKYLSGDKQQ